MGLEVNRSARMLGVFLISFGLVPSVWVTSANAETPLSLDGWVAKHVKDPNALLCKRQFLGDYVFVAKSAPKTLLLGYRVRGGRNNSADRVVVTENYFNEFHATLLAGPGREILRDDNLVINGARYSEHVSENEISYRNSARVDVFLGIRRCASKTCDIYDEIQPDEEAYIIEVCKLKLPLE